MKEKKLNFLEWNSNIFVSSIKKLDLNILLIIILDALFYLSAGYLILTWLSRIQAMSRIQAKLFGFNVPQNIMSIGSERALQTVAEVQKFYYLIIISFILLLIAVIFLASIFKCIIWAKTTNTKITLKLISKFFGLNLIWMGFWFAIVILISLLIQPSQAVFFMAAVLAIAFYLTNIVYAIFMKEQKLHAIISAVKLAVTKIHLFLLPYALVSLVFFIIIRLSALINFKFSQILVGLIVLSYIAVARYYLSAAVIEIENQ